MRVGDFEVTIVREDGTPFHEVAHSDGKVYVAAEPGAIFAIRCKADATTRSSSGRSRKFHFVPKVDGRYVGKVQTIKSDGIKTFQGFVRHSDKSGTTYDLFKFASPTVNHGVQATSLEFKQGKITVEIWEIKKRENCALVYSTSSYVNGAKTVAAMPEGKKFFLAPSLNTVSGGAITGHRLASSKHQRIRARPDAKVTLHYETPSTLLLRKILTRDNPTHAAILDSYPETQQEQPQIQQQQQQTRAPAAFLQSNGRVKRERSGAGGSGAEMIDLSNMISPKPVFLACDLTADENAPRWEKRRG